MTTQHGTASTVFDRLAAVLLTTTSAHGSRARHFPDCFEPQWVQELPLPLGADRPSTQTVALVSADGLERPAEQEVEASYRAHARTRVYESIETRAHGWYSLVCLQLAGLLRRRVTCAVYQSVTGDRTLGPHHDLWDGLILQVRGAKAWTIGPADSNSSTPTLIVTRAGDLLYLPQHVRHDVTTASQEESVHLTFAVTNTPLTAPPDPAAPTALSMGHADT